MLYSPSSELRKGTIEMLASICRMKSGLHEASIFESLSCCADATIYQVLEVIGEKSVEGMCTWLVSAATTDQDL